MHFVAKENETDVLAIVSNVSCQTRGELVFSLDAATKEKSQPLSFPGNMQTHTGFFNLGGLHSQQPLSTRFSISCRSMLPSILHCPPGFTALPAPHHPVTPGPLGLAGQGHLPRWACSPSCPRYTCACVCVCVCVCVVKYTRCKIYHFKLYNSVAFHTFTMLCNHHHHLLSEGFITPKGKPILIK